MGEVVAAHTVLVLDMADARHLRRVQGVDLGTALALLLLEPPSGQMELALEDRLQVLFAGDPAGDVPDGAPR